MTTIGAAWLKSRGEDDSKEYYYTISIDDAVLPLTIDKTKKLVLKENKNKGDNVKAPDFYLEIYIPDATKNKKEPLQDPNIQKASANKADFITSFADDNL